MTTPKEFLTFPILRARDRVRLAAFVARCQLKKDYADLDDKPLVEGFGACAGGAWSSVSGSRCSTRSSTACTTTFRPRTSGRARGACRRRATRVATR